MAGFTDFVEAAMLDEVFGAVNYTPSANIRVGLSTTAINDAGTGITEPPSAAGYARAVVPNTAANWPAATQSGSGPATKSNGNTISFGPATGDWGTIQYFFLADDAGNILASGSIGIPKTITNGDTASFGQGSLTITLD